MEFLMLTGCSSSEVAIARGFISDEIPEPIRRELNADRDRDLLIRMRHLARKKRRRQPDITDEELADYLALAENFQNYEQWLSARRNVVLPGISRSSMAWFALTALAVGLFTATLIVAIAIAV